MIKFQQSQAVSSHSESFWSVVSLQNFEIPSSNIFLTLILISLGMLYLVGLVKKEVMRQKRDL